MSPAATVVRDLIAFARRYAPACSCWRVAGLRQQDGVLACEQCGRVVVPVLPREVPT